MRSLWLILSLVCCVLAQKERTVRRQDGYDGHTKEEGEHYESNHYEQEYVSTSLHLKRSSSDCVYVLCDISLLCSSTWIQIWPIKTILIRVRNLAE